MVGDSSGGREEGGGVQKNILRHQGMLEKHI